MHRFAVFTVAAALGLASCDDPEPEDEPGEAALVAADQDRGPADRDLAKAPAHRHKPPARVVPNAKETFDEVMQLIGERYVDRGLDQDVLWTGATQGMLARLIQLEEHPINTLLSPEELKELKVGTKGAIVGIGVAIEQVAEVVVVREVMQDSPAAKAGLKSGDRILGVDSQRLKDMDLMNVVQLIRGVEGTSLELFVQRDTEEWTETITRGKVQMASVRGRVLEGEVGYVQISSLTLNTPQELDALLGQLKDDGAKELVLDLRHCPGGLFDTSIEVADRFVAADSAVVIVRGRDGEDVLHKTKETHPWESLPMVALIGPKTASGAEIIADALTEHDRATLVGETTLGKGTVESIHELANGWALKLSVSRFLSPSGQARQAAGVRPDVTVPGPLRGHNKALDELSSDDDPQLATAVELLAARR